MHHPLLIVVLVGLIVTALLLASCTLQRRALFPRHMTPPAAALPPIPQSVEQHWIATSAGNVEAWFIPAPRASAASPAPAVMFAHGNAELIDFCLDDAHAYQQLGFSVLLVEYRGYGRSAGSPSQNAIMHDLVAFYDLLAARPDIDAQRIVYHGRSIGASTMAVLSAQRRPAALVMQYAFTSVKDMARHLHLPAFLVVDNFDARTALQTLDCPVLILHGINDEIVPFSHAQILQAAAPNATLVALDCGHNDPPPSDIFWSAIAEFLDVNALR